MLILRKKILFISLLGLLLLSSCRSKKTWVDSLTHPVLKSEPPLVTDTVGLPAYLASILTFDQSDLANLKHRRSVKPAKIRHVPEVPKRLIVKRGTKISSRTVRVPSGYEGVSRIKIYDIAHRDIPRGFEGCRIAFISDIHYKSLLKEKGLSDLVRLLREQGADALLVGGDLHEGCQYVPTVLAALEQVKTPLGTYLVLGNNDYEACYEDIVHESDRHGIHLLEHRVDTLRRNGDRILVAGVRNPFDLKQNGVSPTLVLSPDEFVILLVHTPDYAEDVSIANTDLVLAGHTHGGQVTLFGLYAPIVPSRYGQRFLSGLKYNSAHIPMIITNGIGTSQKSIRLFAPAEIVMLVLHQLTE